jgi:hypothetical protein
MERRRWCEGYGARTPISSLAGMPHLQRKRKLALTWGCLEQGKQMDAKKDYREGCPFSILAQASLSGTVRLKMSESALDSRSTQK